MVQIRWTNAALEELDAIRDYALRVTPAYAERLLDRLITRTDMLGSFSLAGRMVPEYQDPAVRELIESDYRIIYEVIGEQRVDITRIQPTARPLT